MSGTSRVICSPLREEACCQEVYGSNVLIHWEDFATDNAFKLLQRYQERLPSFNDDSQSTAAVTLAAVLGACRMPGVPPLTEQTFLLVGAGSASLGIAALLMEALQQEVRACGNYNCAHAGIVRSAGIA